jgi:hypothetical protein
MRPPRGRAACAWLVFLALGAACSGGTAGTPAAGDIAPARQSDVISRQELDATAGLTSAMDAIQRLRPRFLRNSGTRSMRSLESGPVVRLDNEMAGGLEVLRTVPLGEIGEIRYYSAVDATARFGGITGRPVIHIMRRGAVR